MEQREQYKRWILQEKYKGKRAPQALLDFQRLEQGEHIDYVIGFAEFLGCTIDLSGRPMIPRAETEYWVGEAILKLKEQPLKPRCLDMFAGSGCIGVAVLKHIPEAVMHFAEKEKSLIKQIQMNAKMNGIAKNRYRVFQSDIFSHVPYAYDYIFANPPYIALSKVSNVQESVLQQESFLALFGGEDGLCIMRQFLKEAKAHLRRGGKLYMEFDSWQKPLLTKIMRSHNFCKVEFFRDQYKKWRYVIASA